MPALRKAALIWVALAVAASIFWRESQPAPAPARWPDLVHVEAPRGGAVCASRQLQAALRERAFEYVSGPGRPAPRWTDEFTLVCSEDDEPSGRLHGEIRLRSPRLEEPVYSDSFSAQAPLDRQDLERLSIGLAERLASEPAIASEAERVFVMGQNGLAQAGALAFEHEDWKSAARLLFQGLEGVADPAQAYYGLSAANARLGRSDRALWYALAFMKSSAGRYSPDSLAHLKGLPPPGGFDPAAADLYAEAARLIGKSQLRQAFVVLKLASERVPWDPRPDEAIAELYDQLGFRAVAASWRAPAKLCRHIASDSSLKASLLTSIE